MSGSNTVPNVDGRKIAEARKAKTPRMSQECVAKKLQLEGIDIDRGTVQRIEAGKRSVTRHELDTIAAILKVMPEELLSD